MKVGKYIAVWLTCFMSISFYGATGQDSANQCKDKKLLDDAKVVVAERTRIERELLAILKRSRSSIDLTKTLKPSNRVYQAINFLGALRPETKGVVAELILWLPVKEQRPDTTEKLSLLRTSPAGRALVSCGRVAVQPLLEFLLKCDREEECHLAILCLRNINGFELNRLYLENVVKNMKIPSKTAQKEINKYLEKHP